MDRTTFTSVLRYRSWIQKVFAENERSRAAEICVGGNFRQLGDLEANLLTMIGLEMHMTVVDVGAGSGRLAAALARRGFSGKYHGTDVSAELLDVARGLLPQAYELQLVDGVTIPVRADAADIVCFFSVFTHIPHEESFLYLKEALRILKPGGRVVASYFDFAVPAHWPIFEDTVASAPDSPQCNVFMSRDLWTIWAGKLGMEIAFWQDGGIPFIPIDAPITFENGLTRSGVAALGPIGQSVIALRKPGR